MKKKLLAMILALCLCIGMIPAGMISAAAEVNEGGGTMQVPAPQNVQVTLIGFVDAESGKALVTEISWDALPSDVDGGNKYVELWPTLKEDANLSLPMSFEAWMGQATLIPVDELTEGGIGYVTKDGRSVLRSVVHLLQPGDLKVDEYGMATGIKENDVIDVDLYTAGYDSETQTYAESEHKHVEVVYTEENVRNQKTFTEGGDCAHENKETSVAVKSVSSPVTIDGKSTNVMLVEETEKCSDCQNKKTTVIYRLRFKTRKAMQKYLDGKTVKLLNGKRVHFKGTFEKVERVYWNKKYIKISVDYLKKKGSVILEFSDDFLAGVEDGVHELMVFNGDEFTAMSVTVSQHEMTAIGAFDTEADEAVSAEEYDALMQAYTDDGIEIVDCDLDAFYDGGFMTNADDKEVAMTLSEDTIPPTVTITDEAGAAYTEDKDYTLTYYQIVEDENGEPAEVAIDRDAINEPGDYTVVAQPTGNGALFGEAWAQFRIDLIPGDVNGDGDVTIDDATLVQKYSADLEVLSPEQLAAADVNRDGVVNVVDATMIQKYVAEIIDHFG